MEAKQNDSNKSLMYATKDAIEDFLNQFRIKTKVFRMVTYPREVNMKALYNLGIDASQREEYIMGLTYVNYYNGPKKDNYDPRLGNYWEFGCLLGRTEIYIKLSLGHVNNSTICMSFHPSAIPIVYPYALTG
jgi:hypothetical protein